MLQGSRKKTICVYIKASNFKKSLSMLSGNTFCKQHYILDFKLYNVSLLYKQTHVIISIKYLSNFYNKKKKLKECLILIHKKLVTENSVLY